MGDNLLIGNEGGQRELETLLKAFKNKAGYLTRLQLFHQAFPFFEDCFPAFDTGLSFLFNIEYFSSVYQWNKTEKLLSKRLRQSIYINDSLFHFDITPRNSQRSVFNSFMIGLFEERDSQFAAIMEALQTDAAINGKSISTLYAESDLLLSKIESVTNNRNAIRLEGQILRVFYRGYADGMDNIKRTVSHKRKFIELFLYTQGQMFAQYRRLLRWKIHCSQVDQLKGIREWTAEPNWKAQLQLLQQTGVVDMLESRFAQSEGENRDLLDTTLCFIIGQHQRMSGIVRNYLDIIRAQL